MRSTVKHLHLQDFVIHIDAVMEIMHSFNNITKTNVSIIFRLHVIHTRAIEMKSPVRTIYTCSWGSPRSWLRLRLGDWRNSMVAICQRVGYVSYLWQTNLVYVWSWSCCLKIDRENQFITWMAMTFFLKNISVITYYLFMWATGVHQNTAEHRAFLILLFKRVDISVYFGVRYLCRCQVCGTGESVPCLVDVHLMSHGLLRGWTPSVSSCHLKHTQTHKLVWYPGKQKPQRSKVILKTVLFCVCVWSVQGKTNGAAAEEEWVKWMTGMEEF